MRRESRVPRDGRGEQRERGREALVNLICEQVYPGREYRQTVTLAKYLCRIGLLDRDTSTRWILPSMSLIASLCLSLSLSALCRGGGVLVN